MKSRTRTTADFIKASKALFGYGWQTRLAHELGVDGSTVRRWVSGVVPVNPMAWAALDCWLGKKPREKKRSPKT